MIMRTLSIGAKRIYHSCDASRSSTTGFPAPIGCGVWSPFAADTKHFAPSRESFMINFIVDDLDAVLRRLKKGKVKVDPKGIEASEYGRFAWVMDPEGRKLELWEPPLRKGKR